MSDKDPCMSGVKVAECDAVLEIWDAQWRVSGKKKNNNNNNKDSTEIRKTIKDSDKIGIISG